MAPCRAATTGSTPASSRRRPPTRARRCWRNTPELSATSERRSALIFDVRPQAPVIVRREPPFTEQTAAAHYRNPAPDGTRPGVFWVPLPGPEFNLPRMRRLAYHEAVPGHHFQVALQQELTETPIPATAGVWLDPGVFRGLGPLRRKTGGGKRLV
ncbi:MAG: DUF885 family protein [Opitutus sp.]|nr:DUF885 family protein [Opitutus sp.]